MSKIAASSMVANKTSLMPSKDVLFILKKAGTLLFCLTAAVFGIKLFTGRLSTGTLAVSSLVVLLIAFDSVKAIALTRKSEPERSILLTDHHLAPVLALLFLSPFAAMAGVAWFFFSMIWAAPFVALFGVKCITLLHIALPESRQSDRVCLALKLCVSGSLAWFYGSLVWAIPIFVLLVGPAISDHWRRDQ